MYVPGSGGGGAEGEEAGRGGGARRRSEERLAATHFSKTPFARSSRFFSRASRASRRFFSSPRRAIARIGSLYAAIERATKRLIWFAFAAIHASYRACSSSRFFLRKRASSVLRSRRWREPAPMRRLDSSSSAWRCSASSSARRAAQRSASARSAWLRRYAFCVTRIARSSARARFSSAMSSLRG